MRSTLFMSAQNASLFSITRFIYGWKKIFTKKTFSKDMIYMFCLLYHFSLKWIIKNFYLSCFRPLKHLPSISLSRNSCQDFLKIPSRWEAALETERRCFWKVILESNVAPNITRSTDFFSTVSPIVKAGDWGCIVRDRETIRVLVLLAFNSN